MNALNTLLTFIIVLLIMSFGTGLVLGGPDKGKKIVSWELKKLSQFGWWSLRRLFQTIANFFHWLAKKCGPPQRKKKP